MSQQYEGNSESTKQIGGRARSASNSENKERGRRSQNSFKSRKGSNQLSGWQTNDKMHRGRSDTNLKSNSYQGGRRMSSSRSLSKSKSPKVVNELRRLSNSNRAEKKK